MVQKLGGSHTEQPETPPIAQGDSVCPVLHRFSSVTPGIVE